MRREGGGKRKEKKRRQALGLRHGQSKGKKKTPKKDELTASEDYLHPKE